MDLALNNLQRLICHETQTTNQLFGFIYSYLIIYTQQYDFKFSNLNWLSRLGLQNTLTSSLQRSKTPPTSVLALNNLMFGVLMLN